MISSEQDDELNTVLTMFESLGRDIRAVTDDMVTLQSRQDTLRQQFTACRDSLTRLTKLLHQREQAKPPRVVKILPEGIYPKSVKLAVEGAICSCRHNDVELREAWVLKELPGVYCTLDCVSKALLEKQASKEAFERQKLAWVPPVPSKGSDTLREAFDRFQLNANDQMTPCPNCSGPILRGRGVDPSPNRSETRSYCSTVCRDVAERTTLSYAAKR